MANYKKLKEKLYEARTSRDLTRDYVIERLNKMGIKYNQSSLARIESGDIKNVKPELLRALCEIYNLDIAEMFSLAGMDNFLKALNIITEVKSFDIGMPLYNTIANSKGELIESEEQTINLSLPDEQKAISGLYCVKVIGEQMEPEALNGDILIFKPLCEAWEEMNNKKVVVKVKDEKLLRIVKFENYKPYLYSLNEVYPPIEITPDITCIGSIIYLFREF